MTQTTASQTPDAIVFLQAIGQLLLNFGVPALIMVALYLGYRWLVARMDRSVEVTALRAVARRRVQRREAARARNRNIGRREISCNR